MEDVALVNRLSDMLAKDLTTPKAGPSTVNFASRSVAQGQKKPARWATATHWP
jgi:hypothetical protein